MKVLMLTIATAATLFTFIPQAGQARPCKWEQICDYRFDPATGRVERTCHLICR